MGTQIESCSGHCPPLEPAARCAAVQQTARLQQRLVRRAPQSHVAACEHRCEFPLSKRSESEQIARNHTMPPLPTCAWAQPSQSRTSGGQLGPLDAADVVKLSLKQLKGVLLACARLHRGYRPNRAASSIHQTCCDVRPTAPFRCPVLLAQVSNNVSCGVVVRLASSVQQLGCSDGAGPAEKSRGRASQFGLS